MPKAKTGIPYNPNARPPAGQISPPLMGRLADGTAGAALFEQAGRDGVSRLYGAAPHYRRVLREGEELEEVEVAAKAAPVAPAAPAKPAAKGGRKTAPAPEAPKSKPTGRFGKMKPAAPAADEAADDAGLDLAAWARGELQVPFEEVAAAIKDRFDELVNDETEAAVVLVTNQILAEEEIKITA